MTHQLTISKIGLRREDAADFIGLKVTKFNELIKEGRLPEPVQIDGCRVWDVRKLIAAFDALSEPRNEWDD